MGNLWSGISRDPTRGTLTRIDPWARATVGYSDLRRTASTAVRASLRSCRTAAGADRLRSDIQHRPSPAGGSSYCSAAESSFFFVADASSAAAAACLCRLAAASASAFALAVAAAASAARRSSSWRRSLRSLASRSFFSFSFFMLAMRRSFTFLSSAACAPAASSIRFDSIRIDSIDSIHCRVRVPRGGTTSEIKFSSTFTHTSICFLGPPSLLTCRAASWSFPSRSRCSLAISSCSLAFSS